MKNTIVVFSMSVFLGVSIGQTAEQQQFQQYYHMDGGVEGFNSNGHRISAAVERSVESTMNRQGEEGKALRFTKTSLVELPIIPNRKALNVTVAFWAKFRQFQGRLEDRSEWQCPVSFSGTQVFIDSREEAFSREFRAYWGAHNYQLTHLLIPEERWVHLAYTVTGGTRVDFFFNGQLVETDFFRQEIPRESKPSYVGRDWTRNSPFLGDIDEVILLEKALEPRSVRNLFLGKRF